MKRLKIFEEFKVGSFYTSSKDDSNTQFETTVGLREISGGPVVKY